MMKRVVRWRALLIILLACFLLPTVVYADEEGVDSSTGLVMQQSVQMTSPDDNQAELFLEGYVTGKNETVAQGIPTDTVLVLDQSDTMNEFFGDTTRQDAMKTSAKAFIEMVGAQYDEAANHRIAIVTFADEAIPLVNWTAVDEAGVKILTDAVDTLNAGGETRVDLGMSCAKELLHNDMPTLTEGQREKAVILFSGGQLLSGKAVDTAVEDEAIRHAKALKEANTAIYCIGLFEEADATRIYGEKGNNKIVCKGKIGNWWNGHDLHSAAANRFLNFLSSNFLTPNELGLKYLYNKNILGEKINERYFISKVFQRSSATYYLTGEDTSSLRQLFKFVGVNRNIATISLNEQGMLKEVIAPTFQLPENTTPADIVCSYVSYMGNGQWGTPDNQSEALKNIAVRITGKEVVVTGFAFDKHFVLDHDGKHYGGKLCIRIPIEIDKNSEVVSGAIRVSDTGSGIYRADGEAIGTFSSPVLPLHQITWQNQAGNTVRKIMVMQGAKQSNNPTPPPTAAGYKFKEWVLRDGRLGDTNTVLENLVYQATYQKDESQTKDIFYTVRFVTEGVEQTADTYTVKKKVWCGENQPVLAIENIEIKPYRNYRYAHNDAGLIKKGNFLIGEGTIENGGVVTVFYTKRHNVGSSVMQEKQRADEMNIPALLTKKSESYLTGYPDGSIRPEENVTRAEVAEIFYRLLDEAVKTQQPTDEYSFHDVQADAWYHAAISGIAGLHLVTGYPDGHFYPDKTMTRAEFASIVAQLDTNDNAKIAGLVDIHEHWAANAISKAVSNGWIHGYEDGSFRPEQKITRAEVVAIINRVLQREHINKARKMTDRKVWIDNTDTSRWYYSAIQEASTSYQ